MPKIEVIKSRNVYFESKLHEKDTEGISESQMDTEKTAKNLRWIYSNENAPIVVQKIEYCSIKVLDIQTTY